MLPGGEKRVHGASRWGASVFGVIFLVNFNQSFRKIRMSRNQPLALRVNH